MPIANEPDASDCQDSSDLKSTAFIWIMQIYFTSCPVTVYVLSPRWMKSWPLRKNFRVLNEGISTTMSFDEMISVIALIFVAKSFHWSAALYASTLSAGT